MLYNLQNYIASGSVTDAYYQKIVDFYFILLLLYQILVIHDYPTELADRNRREKPVRCMQSCNVK